jgi:uncharacterized protein
VTGPYEPTPPPTMPPPQPDDPPAWAVTAAGDRTTTGSRRTREPEEAHRSRPGTPGHGDADGPPPVAGPAAPPIEVPDLDDRDRALDPRIITVWRFSTVTSLLFPSLLLSAVSVGFLGAPYSWIVPALALIGIVVLAAWYPGARYARWRWRFTDLAVELEHGVVVRQAEALPYFRIQQIDVNQGPIDRLLGLASLQVTSASASGSVSLPGIAATDAPGLRRALLARAAAAVGEQGTGVRDAV